MQPHFEQDMCSKTYYTLELEVLWFEFNPAIIYTLR